MKDKIKIDDDQYIDVSSSRESLKCSQCRERVEYVGAEAWKMHRFCPYCGAEYL